MEANCIAEDCLKDKMKGGRRRRRRKGDGVITIAMLTEIIKELMRIFWEFVRADKDEANVILKGHLGTQIELQNPDDSKLLMDLRTNIQKVGFLESTIIQYYKLSFFYLDSFHFQW